MKIECILAKGTEHGYDTGQIKFRFKKNFNLSWHPFTWNYFFLNYNWFTSAALH